MKLNIQQRAIKSALKERALEMIEILHKAGQIWGRIFVKSNTPTLFPQISLPALRELEALHVISIAKTRSDKIAMFRGKDVMTKKQLAMNESLVALMITNTKKMYANIEVIKRYCLLQQNKPVDFAMLKKYQKMSSDCQKKTDEQITELRKRNKAMQSEGEYAI